MSQRVLIVDDEESICWGLSKLCSQIGLEADTAASAELGLEKARETPFDLVILDVRLPGMDGLTAIRAFKEIRDSLPVITITAFGDLQTAIQSIQNGAFEYIVKPFELNVVESKIRQALVVPSAAGSNQTSDPEMEVGEGASRFELVGTSAAMQRVFKQIALTTTSASPVLITGESGTGKELAARSIHEFGEQSSGPFVAVNIAALSPSLAESELFGHVKGAFTGADSNRVGLIQKASGGTLFLDEVGEIPIEIQVKLLRVLDLGEVTAVGSDKPVRTNFRLISATHRDLPGEISASQFREDLYYRIRTFQIELPALRERTGDIPALVDYFLRRRKYRLEVSSEFVTQLERRSWPGNVRELQSVVERAATFARGGILTPDHLEHGGRDHETPFGTVSHDDLVAEIRSLVSGWTREQWAGASSEGLYQELIEIIEPAILKTAFELSDRQYSAAARRLGVHRTTLKKKLNELDTGIQDS